MPRLLVDQDGPAGIAAMFRSSTGRDNLVDFSPMENKNKKTDSVDLLMDTVQYTCCYISNGDHSCVGPGTDGCGDNLILE